MPDPIHVTVSVTELPQYQRLVEFVAEARRIAAEHRDPDLTEALEILEDDLVRLREEELGE